MDDFEFLYGNREKVNRMLGPIAEILGDESQLNNNLGNWDADINSPELANGFGNVGDYYIVSVAGTQDLGSGSVDYLVGETIRYSGTTYEWEIIVQSSSVESVNGYTGIIVLNTDDISEGSVNLYWTNTRFDTSLASSTTDDLSEGSANLYYTDVRDTSNFTTNFAAQDTDNLSEGTSNLYYTISRFDTRLGESDTDDLSEGSTNLYYTDVRADARIVNANVLTDGDFTSNGILNRTGAGVYSILTIGTDIQAHSTILDNTTSSFLKYCSI